MIHEALLTQIKQLPPLPESALQIEAVYQNPNSTFNDMVKILDKDPLLTADILKAANSPLYGFSREINSIAQAVGLFGMGTVRGFALAGIVKKSFTLDLDPYGISGEQFSNLSKKQHALATNWYLRKDPKLLGILSPAAFLVEIGKVLIARFVTSNGETEQLRTKIAELGSIEAAEREICGADTPEVSAAIFEQWQFEPELIDVIRHCSAPGDRLPSQILHVVRAAFSLDGTVTEATEARALEAVDSFGLDRASFQEALAGLKA